MSQNGDQKTYVSQPLQTMVDIQLGTDGHPWIRLQFATPGMATTITFPVESSETVIENISTGIRKAAKTATRKQVEVIPPDFTGIKASEGR